MASLDDEDAISDCIESFFRDLPTKKQIQERIHGRYNNLFHIDEDGKHHPLVCSICDEFLTHEKDVCLFDVKKLEKCKQLLQWSNVNNAEVSTELQAHFAFDTTTNKVPGNVNLDGLALSPRGRIHRKSSHHRSRAGLTSCSECKNSIEKKQLPFFAIINKNFVGGTPQCLLDLTDIELALITPVRSYGFCFTYVGGRTQNLKGCLTFMRVKERSTARAFMQLEALGLNKHVLILVSGYMTTDQRQKVQYKSEIRTDKMIAAVEWLCANNCGWQDVNLNELRSELENTKPVFVDHSEEVESNNQNVEEQELFSCYFPDGATTSTSGGFDDRGAFKEFVEEMKRKNFDVEFKCNLEKTFATGHGGVDLTRACLLQFPYGLCGMDATRLKKDGSFSTTVPLEKYLRHLSLLSQPVFQRPLFQLILFSLTTKQKILQTARLQVRGKVSAKDLAEGLNYDDVNSAIRSHRQGNRYGGTRVSRKLLDSCDACSRALPHTNDAAKKARATGEATQHHFGIGSVFLTVTFDDENSFLMQVYTGVSVDDDTDITLLSDDELKARRIDRQKTRINFPGIAALNFEMLLHVLLEEVVGWDMRRRRPAEKPGYFGTAQALTLAIEEQGRKTLHVHLTLWIEMYRFLQKRMFFGSKIEKRLANQFFLDFHDRSVTTQMFEGTTPELLKTLFIYYKWKCALSIYCNRTIVVVKSLQ